MPGTWVTWWWNPTAVPAPAVVEDVWRPKRRERRWRPSRDRPAELAPPEVVERTGTLVGRAVASVANLLDLPLAVVSGSVALGFGAPFFAAAQREVEARCGLEFARGTRVVPGGLGDEGPLIGAARVGWLGLELGEHHHEGGGDGHGEGDGDGETMAETMTTRGS